MISKWLRRTRVDAGGTVLAFSAARGLGNTVSCTVSRPDCCLFIGISGALITRNVTEREGQYRLSADTDSKLSRSTFILEEVCCFNGRYDNNCDRTADISSCGVHVQLTITRVWPVTPVIAQLWAVSTPPSVASSAHRCADERYFCKSILRSVEIYKLNTVKRDHSITPHTSPLQTMLTGI